MAIYICFKNFDYNKIQVKIILNGHFFHLHRTNASYLHIYDSIFIQLSSCKVCILTGNCYTLFIETLNFLLFKGNSLSPH